MKKSKIYLIGFILILSFYSGLFGTNIPLDREDDECNRNIKINSSASISHEYEWHRTWYGNAYSVAVDSTDDVYVAGNTGTLNPNISLVKYDNSGVKQWNRTWSGVDYYQTCRKMALDSSDNVYLAGWTDDGLEENSVLLKYDKNGVLQWNRTLDRGDSGGIAVDSLDNIYLVGTIYFVGSKLDMILLKYDNSGVYQWNRTWGGNDYDNCYDVTIDSSDNIYLTGNTGDPFGEGSYDMALVKYDSSGIYQWNRTWGGNERDDSYGVVVDSLGNVYITGTTESFGAGLTDMVLIKYDSFGVLLWNRTYGGSDFDNSYGVAVDSLDNVYITGEIDGGTIVLIKYNSYGEQEWIITTTSIGQQGESVALDSNDNVYIAARGSSTQILVKYSKIPEVIINSPYHNELFGSVVPNFDISIFEPNLDTTWYTLDNGITNISFSGLTGTINQTEWDKKENGTVPIRFYAKNNLGKEGYAEVSIFKDINDPEIIINVPSQDEKFGEEAPNYEISITEPNLESIWYTIDGGLNNYTITQSSGTINQTAWEAAPYGNIAIRFYAEDIVGNSDYSQVVVEKVKGEKKILGYPILLFISMIGLITAISLKKKFN